MFPPILKLLGFLANSGLLTLLPPFFPPADAVTTFLPFATFFGYREWWIRRDIIEKFELDE